MKILERLKWLWYSGRYTKVKLVRKDTIGVSEGYFECGHEHNAIISQYYKDLKTMHYKEAGKIMEDRHNKMLRKYFGPKYVKE